MGTISSLFHFNDLRSYKNSIQAVLSPLNMHGMTRPFINPE